MSRPAGGTGGRPLTVLVEPDSSGHRFQWVGHLARLALAEGDVLLLTSKGSEECAEFRGFLGDLPIEVDPCFAERYPSARQMAAELVRVHEQRPITRFVIMDADNVLKRWWLDAPKALRARRTRPYGIALMTRFPPRLPWHDRHLLYLWTAKGIVGLAAMARGSLQRIAYIAARDQLRHGLVFKRLRDPAICSAHARDRAALREKMGLPLDRRIVGILGAIDVRKCVPMVGAATFAADPAGDLLLAGTMTDDVLEWVDGLGPEERRRVHVFNGFLPDEDLDTLTASCDVVAVVQLNPGPSGIMGKAQVAGVPVLSAGSRVRRKEAEALGSGIATDITEESIADGLRTLFARGDAPVPAPPTLPTAEEFAAVALGLPWHRPAPP